MAGQETGLQGEGPGGSTLSQSAEELCRVAKTLESGTWEGGKFLFFELGLGYPRRAGALSVSWLEGQVTAQTSELQRSCNARSCHEEVIQNGESMPRTHTKYGGLIPLLRASCTPHQSPSCVKTKISLDP